MIGKKEILEMTSKELEAYLNTCVTNIKIKDDDDSFVKGKMIEEAEKLFDSSIIFSVPYYTNREIAISLGQVYITFKVSAKATGETVQVTRLKKRDVKEAGKFKFDNIHLRFNTPLFVEENIKEYKIKVESNYVSGGGKIYLKHRKEKFKDMLVKEVLKQELETQDKDWSNVRATLILHAAQPMIKKAFLKSNLSQENWNQILKKTEEVNSGLIDQEIEKMFTINL